MKVKINTAIPSVSKGGKSFQKINYDNDQKASAWDSNFVPFMGKEVEVDITEKDGFKNIKLVGAAAAEPAANASAPISNNNEWERRSKALALSLEFLRTTNEKTISDKTWIDLAANIDDILINGIPKDQK